MNKHVSCNIHLLINIYRPVIWDCLFRISNFPKILNNGLLRHCYVTTRRPTLSFETYFERQNCHLSNDAISLSICSLKAKKIEIEKIVHI